MKIGINLTNLMWDTAENRAKAINAMGLLSSSIVRDGMRQEATSFIAANYLATLGPVSLVLSIMPEDFDGNEQPPLPLDLINLDRWEARFRIWLEAFVAASVDLAIAEAGNELDYYLFNRMIDKNAPSLIDDQLLPLARAFARFLERAAMVLREYYPRCKLLPFGIAHFRGKTPNGSVVNPGKILAILGDLDGRNYLELIDGLNVHIYPSISDNVSVMIPERLTKFVTDTGTQLPVYVTELGYANAVAWPGGRYNAHVQGYYALRSCPQRIDAIILYALDDFIGGKKWYVDPITYFPLPEARFLRQFNAI